MIRRRQLRYQGVLVMLFLGFPLVCIAADDAPTKQSELDGYIQKLEQHIDDYQDRIGQREREIQGKQDWDDVGTTPKSKHPYRFGNQSNWKKYQKNEKFGPKWYMLDIDEKDITGQMNRHQIKCAQKKTVCACLLPMWPEMANAAFDCKLSPQAPLIWPMEQYRVPAHKLESDYAEHTAYHTRQQSHPEYAGSDWASVKKMREKAQKAFYQDKDKLSQWDVKKASEESLKTLKKRCEANDWGCSNDDIADKEKLKKMENIYSDLGMGDQAAKRQSVYGMGMAQMGWTVNPSWYRFYYWDDERFQGPCNDPPTPSPFFPTWGFWGARCRYGLTGRELIKVPQFVSSWSHFAVTLTNFTAAKYQLQSMQQDFWQKTDKDHDREARKNVNTPDDLNEKHSDKLDDQGTKDVLKNSMLGVKEVANVRTFTAYPQQAALRQWFMAQHLTGGRSKWSNASDSKGHIVERYFTHREQRKREYHRTLRKDATPPRRDFLQPIHQVQKNQNEEKRWEEGCITEGDDFVPDVWGADNADRKKNYGKAQNWAVGVQWVDYVSCPCGYFPLPGCPVMRLNTQGNEQNEGR